jgi:hypothetical protein
VVSSRPENGVSEASASEASCLLGQGLRSSGREGKAGTRQGELPASLIGHL